MNEPATLAELIAPVAASDPERVALIFEERSYTYAALDERIERAADALFATGVRPGDRVALMFGNDPVFVIANYAVARLGAVVVPINPMYRHVEIAHILRDCEPSAAVVEDVLWTDVADVFLTAGVATLVAGVGENRREARDWDQALREAAARPPYAPRPEDLAALVYTSGTTGKAKGAMHSHLTLLSNTRQVGCLERRYMRETDRVLNCLPLCHMFGMQIGLNALYRVGGSVMLMRRFDANGALANIERYRCTFLPAAPPMVTRWVAMPELRTYDLRSLRVVTCGSAPLHASVLDAFHEATGVRISESYGLTEAGPTTHSNSAAAVDKVGTVGPPILDVECRLVDEAGRDVARGEPGEIVVRSPSVMLGYWQNPEATGDALRDGWLHTGDVATVDEHGYYTIVDRLKDMISVGGFKVWPLEIEGALFAHPEIADVAIVGMPDGDSGERPVAFVVVAPGARLTASDVTAFARGTLAKYKIPQRVEFLAELPRNSTGKVLRRELRERARALTPS